MKNLSFPVHFLSKTLICSFSLCVTSQVAQSAIRVWDGGATTGDWQTGSNWNPDSGNPDFNGTFAHRLNVNGSQTLIYTSAEGTTIYSGDTVTGGGRGLVIGSGSSGSMTITGGTFSTASATQDVIGNGNNSTGVLTINGGSFIGSTAGGTILGLGTGTARVSTLNVQSGSATFGALTMNTNTATINMTGGTLEANTVSTFSGNSTIHLDGGSFAANGFSLSVGATAAINFNGGTLKARVNNGGYLTGLTSATVKAGGANIDSNGFDITIGQALLDGTGGGGLTKSSAGVLTLTGTNTYTGTTSISGGTLQIGNGSTTGTLGSGNVTNNSILAFNRSNSYAVGNAISGTGAIIKSAAGLLELSASNTYSGNTTINAGAIIASNVNSLGTSAGGTTVANNAALGLSGGLNFNTGETVTISGPGLTTANGAFAAVQRGAIQSVSGDNTFTGNVIFTSTSNTRIGVQDGATLTLSGNITEQTAGSTLSFRHGNTAGSNIIISGSSNSWTGATEIYGGGGAVTLGANNALSTSALLRVGTTGITGNSKLDLNGYNQAIPGISQVGGTAGIITNNGSSDSLLTITGMSANQAYFGSIQDGATNKVSLVLNSTGNTQALSGANSYTGTTTVTAGRLNINGSITSATTVASGATLGGDGVINANVTLNGILRPGQGGTTDRTLSITGTLSATIGSSIMFNIASETAHDQLSVGGISLTNTTLNIESFTDTTITELGAGQGLSFLTSGASFYKIIDGTTTGMFANVTNTMTTEQLSFYGLSGTQYTFEVDGQKFWIAEGSTYLVAIPESSTSLLGLLGGLTLLRRKRK